MSAGGQRDPQEELGCRVDLRLVKAYVNKFLSRVAEASNHVDVNEVLREAKDSSMSEVTTFSSGDLRAQWLKTALKMASDLLDEVNEGLGRAGYAALKLNFRLMGPGLVGAGGGPLKSVFEVGLAIDPVLGLPYYSGSELKGAMRALIEGSCRDKEDPTKLDKDAEKLIEYLFGLSAKEESEEGHVFVSDMYPIGCARPSCGIYRGLIVNPHYMSGGQAVETELDAEPNPVKHVGIEDDIVFGVVLAYRHDKDEVERLKLVDSLSSMLFTDESQGSKSGCLVEVLGAQVSKRLLDSVKSRPDDVLEALSVALLITALRLGVGARSSKGYNYFEPLAQGESFYGPDNLEIVGYSFTPQRGPEAAPSQGGGQGRRRPPGSHIAGPPQHGHGQYGRREFGGPQRGGKR